MVLLLDVPRSGISAAFYESARSLGLSPILVTASRPARSSDTGYDHILVPRMELSAVQSAIDTIGQRRVAGVFTDVEQSAVLAARLSAAIGRPHADTEAISLCNNKYRLREFLKRRGFDTVDFDHVTSASEAREAALRLGGAVVVKPPSASGSDGVRVCRTPDETAAHTARLLKRRSGGVLVETYIDAPQFSVELFDGRVLNVKRSYTADGPFPIMIGHDAPPSLQSGHLKDIGDYARAVVEEVGICKGPSAVQLRESDEEKHVIEINARPSMNSPAELSIAVGINIADLCLKFSCGLPYEQDFTKRRNKTCATRFVVRDGSSVRSIEGLEKARQLPGVKSIFVLDSHLFRRGPSTSGHDRIAIVHSEGDDVEQAAASANAAISELTVVYDSFPIDVIKFHGRRIRRSLVKKWRSLRERLGRARPSAASQTDKALVEDGRP